MATMPTVRIAVDAAGLCRCTIYAKPPPPPPPRAVDVTDAAPPLQNELSEDNAPECAICMRAISFSCTGGSCAHHFCAACLLQFSASVHHTSEERRPRAPGRDCPKCRAPLTQLILDTEYDEFIGGATRRPNDLSPFTVSLCLQRGQHAGITVKSTDDKFGVRLTEVKRRDAAYKAGLRKDDIIIWINGVPCRGHEETVKRIERTKESGGVPLSIVVLPRPPGRRSIALTAAATSPETPRRRAAADDVSEQPAAASTMLTAVPTAPASAPYPVAATAAATTAHTHGLQLIGEISWEEEGGKYVYTLYFADSSAVNTVSLPLSFSITGRYSAWRKLFETVQSRWPRVLSEPHPLPFPPKTMPAYVVGRMSGSATAVRAAGLERFMKELLERARDPSMAINGLAEWLQHWLRSCAMEDREQRQWMRGNMR